MSDSRVQWNSSSSSEQVVAERIGHTTGDSMCFRTLSHMEYQHCLCRCIVQAQLLLKECCKLCSSSIKEHAIISEKCDRNSKESLCCSPRAEEELWVHGSEKGFFQEPSDCSTALVAFVNLKDNSGAPQRWARLKTLLAILLFGQDPTEARAQTPVSQRLVSHHSSFLYLSYLGSHYIHGEWK